MDNTDPYRASGAPLAPAPRKLDIDSAGKGRRFLNYLIDTVTYFIVLAVMGGVVGLLGREAAIAWLEGMDPLAAWGLNVSIMLAYYTVMEGALGFTVGKLITNTRVVDEYGRRPGFARALGRSVARLIPFEAFSLLLSDEARGWHDSLARTYVVRRPRAGQPAGRPRVSVHEAFADGVGAQRAAAPAPESISA